jgi:hypothetical protein
MDVEYMKSAKAREDIVVISECGSQLRSSRILPSINIHENNRGQMYDWVTSHRDCAKREDESLGD